MGAKEKTTHEKRFVSVFLPAGGRDRRRAAGPGVRRGADPFLAGLLQGAAVCAPAGSERAAPESGFRDGAQRGAGSGAGAGHLCVSPGGDLSSARFALGPWPGLFCGNAPWAALYEKFTVT